MASPPINRSQGRSVVVSTHGIVASEHPLASQAGAMVLAQGGHAVDAAVAANAVMGVVCPMMCGIGGDLFAIVSEHDGKMHGVNASGWAPARLTPELLESRHAGGMPQSGVHSVTVPGAVAGWSLLLERFGRTPLTRLLEPATALADEGFPVAEITAKNGAIRRLPARRSGSREDIPAVRTPAFVRHGISETPTWRGRTARLLQTEPTAFYRGEVARRLVAGLERRGATMTAADLSEFRAQWADPDLDELSWLGRLRAAAEWRRHCRADHAEHPGGVARIRRSAAITSADALHLLIEAKKLAYADMLRHVADPEFSDVPVAAMLSKDYARERAALIDNHRARGQVGPGSPKLASSLASEGGDTTYLSVVDRAGNMVSLIQSNFASFGSGVVAEGTGFPLQNRGALFTLDRSHPNVLAPRKRPLHTIIPAFMTSVSRGGPSPRSEPLASGAPSPRAARASETRIAFGIMGGWNQSQAHAQFVSNIVDRGMNIQAALEARALHEAVVRRERRGDRAADS